MKTRTLAPHRAYNIAARIYNRACDRAGGSYDVATFRLCHPVKARVIANLLLHSGIRDGFALALTGPARRSA